MRFYPIILFVQVMSILAVTTKGADKTSFTFCVVSDARCSEKVNRNYPDRGDGVAKFKDLSKAIAKLKGADKPDFVLFIGDLQMEKVIDQLKAFPVPAHAIAGDTRVLKGNKKLRYDTFPKDFKVKGKTSDYYSFVHKGVRFIGISNTAHANTTGVLCTERIEPRGQCQWIEKEFAKPEKKKIIFSHVPSHPTGKDLNMYMTPSDSLFLNELIVKHKPLAMFSGHQQKKTKQDMIGETPSYIVASSSVNKDKSPLGFLMVKVTPAEVKTKFIEIKKSK